jgi:HemY protein
MKSEERALPKIALAAAAAFEAEGEGEQAGRVLENAVNAAFSPALIAAYARCDAGLVPRRLATAEAWLQRRPGDADLLAALGILCLNGSLWGPAERYLERSLAQRDDQQCHALLGALYDRLGRAADAARHWRLASSAVLALPVLAADAALPAADTGADPHRVDAEGEYDSWLIEAPAAPLALGKPAEAAEAPVAEAAGEATADAAGEAAAEAAAAETAAPLVFDYAIDAHEDYSGNAPIVLRGPPPGPPDSPENKG